MRYRYVGPAPLFVPDLHLVVHPGDEVDSGDTVLRHNDFREIKDRPERPAKEA